MTCMVFLCRSATGVNNTSFLLVIWKQQSGGLRTMAFCATMLFGLPTSDGFINICAGGKIEDLAEELIPTLGTDAFFELI